MVRMDVAGRDRLDAEVLGEIAKKTEPPRVSPLEWPLEFDEEPIASEGAREACCRVRIEEPEAATRATGKADEPLVQLGDELERHRRLEGRDISRPSGVRARSRVRGGEQAAEIPVPAPRLHEQRDVRTSVERDLRAGNRPHAERLCRVRELERAVDAVVVGQRERLVPELRCPRRKLLRLRRTVEERVGRMAVQLDVAGHL